MRPGLLDHKVSLSRCPQTTPDSDGFYEDLTPRDVWAAVVPAAPTDDGRRITHLVTLRYHPQVTMDTRIVYVDARLGRTREFFVRGVQHVNDRGAELRCLCEEVIP